MWYGVDKVKLNKTGLDFTLNNPGGQLGIELYKRAKRVARHAKAQAPIGSGPTAGRLKRSIRVYRHQRYTKGQTIRIGTSVPYAKFVHEGTRPHTIVPKNPGGALMFVPKKGGMVVITKKVNHPGIRRPNRFLTDNVKYIYLPG
jgi:hypothetical protein